MAHSKCVPVSVASDMQDLLNVQSFLGAKASPALKLEIEAVKVRCVHGVCGAARRWKRH